MVKPWQAMCPSCGENAYIGVDNYFIARCDKCGTRWTMSELEIYELTHPDKETQQIVDMIMDLAYHMATEE